MRIAPWRRWPVRLRIALVYAGLAALNVGTLTLIVLWAARGAMFTALDEHLHRDLELTLTALEFEPVPRLRGFVHASMRPGDPDPVFQLWRNGRLLLSHPPQAAMFADLPPPPAAAAYSSADGRAGPVRVHELPLESIGPGWTLRVAREQQALQQRLRRLVLQLAVLALTAASVGVALAAWAGRRALQPLVSIAEAIGGLGPQRLQTRLPLPETGDELALLVRSHNAMLDRIESGYRDAERFATLMAHELRTPLASLRAGAEIALSAPPPRDAERLAETLRVTLEETDRLTQLTNRLLLLARTPAAARCEVFDVLALLREAADLMQPLAEACGHGLAVRESPPVMVRSDRVLVMQIVLDLVDNALRHGGPTVNVELHAQARGREVDLVVSDDGVGMPAAAAPRGTGLGMELARRLAAALGGDVVWTSRPRGGTRARFRLAGTSDTPNQPR